MDSRGIMGVKHTDESDGLDVARTKRRASRDLEMNDLANRGAREFCFRLYNIISNSVLLPENL